MKSFPPLSLTAVLRDRSKFHSILFRRTILIILVLLPTYPLFGAVDGNIYWQYGCFASDWNQDAWSSTPSITVGQDAPDGNYEFYDQFTGLHYNVHILNHAVVSKGWNDGATSDHAAALGASSYGDNSAHGPFTFTPWLYPPGVPGNFCAFSSWSVARNDLCNTGGNGHGTVKYVDVGAKITIGTYTPLDADPGQTKLCDANTGCPAKAPMAGYSIHLLLASLHISDTPISYAPQRGPRVDFEVVYNQREANQPQVFDFGNFGPKWTHSWLSYVTDYSSPATASVYVRGGGTETYTGWDSVTQSYSPAAQSLTVLVKTSPDTYERRLPDGSKEIFSAVFGTTYPRRIFLSSVADPTGNAVSISYDSNLRITAITDPLGQITTLAYGLSGDPLKITQITDPFGRIVNFEYTSGQLSKITDPVGIQSQFVYESGTDFVNSLTTPYGTTTFQKGENGNSLRWLEATDSLGGKERVEYNDSDVGILSSEGVAPAGTYNEELNERNSFYWNKKAMADAPGDYTMAQVTHWLLSADANIVSGIKASEKQALEGRIWYAYPGQTDGRSVGTSALPTDIARVLDDGTTQMATFEYNSLGNLTKETDPAGAFFPMSTRRMESTSWRSDRLVERITSCCKASPIIQEYRIFPTP